MKRKQPRLLELMNISFKNDGEIKTLLEEHKLNNFMACTSGPQRMFKETPTVGKWDHIGMHLYQRNECVGNGNCTGK